MAKTKKRETNPRSKYDALASKFARKAMDIIKSQGVLKRRMGHLAHIDIGERVPFSLGKVNVQGRSIPIRFPVYRDEDYDGISIHGQYLPKWLHHKERIDIALSRPLEMSYKHEESWVYEAILDVARHELQHALQKPSGESGVTYSDLRGRHGRLADFKSRYLNKDEVDAYAAGVYGLSKKTRTSFYSNLNKFRSAIMVRWPDIDKKLIDQFIVMVHERALALYPELLKQKPIPKKRIKREQKAKSRTAMEKAEQAVIAKAQAKAKAADAKAEARAKVWANPAKRKPAKKKPARKKAPPYQLLINRCQKLWDHYCERPSRSRLKPVLEHLDKMKGSTSKKVDAERARCLRVANKEARRLKMK